MDKTSAEKEAKIYDSPKLKVMSYACGDIITGSGMTETDTPQDVDVLWNPIWG